MLGSSLTSLSLSHFWIIVGEKAESRWHWEKIYDILNGKNKALKKVVVPSGLPHGLLR